MDTLIEAGEHIVSHPLDLNDNKQRLQAILKSAATLEIGHEPPVSNFVARASDLIAFAESCAHLTTTERKEAEEALTKSWQFELNGSVDASRSSSAHAGVNLSDKDVRQSVAAKSTERVLTASLPPARYDQLRGLWQAALASHMAMRPLLNQLFRERLLGQWSWKWNPNGNSAIFRFTFTSDGAWRATVTYYGNWSQWWSQFTELRGVWRVVDDVAPRLTVELTDVRKLYLWFSSKPSPFALIKDATLVSSSERKIIIKND
ncbi:MAG: hypothetical protein FJ280_25075, partial [Planctomycetes bacterium]|nr:hypothetical protein [Planctomycetota bacterium]